MMSFGGYIDLASGNSKKTEKTSKKKTIGMKNVVPVKSGEKGLNIL